MDIKNALLPNISGAPGTTPQINSPKGKVEGSGDTTEFSKVLNEQFAENLNKQSFIKEPIKFSAHASQRMQDRSISMEPELMGKLRTAFDRAESKGLQDTLVLTDHAAFIVNVGNRTVVTVVDRNSLDGNVFTNIDGAVIA